MAGETLVPDQSEYLVPQPTPLARALQAEIQQHGPLPFNEYMKAWLYGMPDQQGNYLPGYYTSGEAVIGDQDGKILGSEVDFVTPSEITPLFGYVMVDQLMQMRREMGNPSNFTIVEMGAGNGTFAYDILNGIKDRVKKDKLDSDALDIQYIIVESSPSMIKRQKERLTEFSDQITILNASAGEVPLKEIEGVFISCELPDAFPTHVIRNSGTLEESIYEELFIDEGKNEKFKEHWRPLSKNVRRYVNNYPPEIEVGKFYPVNIDAEKWMQDVGRALKKGFVVTIDYGYIPTRPISIYGAPSKPILNGADMMQEDAFLNSACVGYLDLTQGVDFQVLADAGYSSGLDTVGYVNLTGFLWGLNYDLFKSHSDLDFGNRVFKSGAVELLMDNRFINFWDVLVQAKGLESTPEFLSLRYFGNPDEDEEIEIRSIKPPRNGRVRE